MIKVYTKNHILLDELDDYSKLTWTKTLNGVGKATFSVGLESSKTTEQNLQFHNHVEIYDENSLVWGGYIVGLEFNSSAITVNCYGYLGLLKNRRFRDKNYTEKTYGALFAEMLADTNAIESTGITLGVISTGSLMTQRTTSDTDVVLDRMLDIADDYNYNIEVDDSRAFNFYVSKGSLKKYMLLEYGGDTDNIIEAPTLSKSVTDLANSIYAETDGETPLVATASDSISNELYGLVEKTISLNSGIVVQSTVDNAVNGELYRKSNPLSSVNLEIIDSSLCPFSEIEVGDIIPVSLIPYWNFRGHLKILEMTYNADKKTRTLTVGDVVFRSNRPMKKFYKGA